MLEDGATLENYIPGACLSIWLSAGEYDGTLHRHYKDLTHHSPDSRQSPTTHPHAKHTDTILRHRHIWTLLSAFVASSMMWTVLLAFIIEIHVLSHGLQLPVRGNPLSYLNQHVRAVTCKNSKSASGILTVLFRNSIMTIVDMLDVEHHL